MRTTPIPDPTQWPSRRSSRVLPLVVAALFTFAVRADANSYTAEYLAPFAVPAAMNQAGAVVGWNPVWNSAFVYDDVDGYVELPCLKGFVTCRAVDINEAGWIVGHAESNGLLKLRRALLWKPSTGGYKIEFPVSGGGSATLATPPPNHSEALAIDNSNRVIGRAAAVTFAGRSEFSWLWNAKGGVRRLAVPGPVVDLNDSGQIAGNGVLPYVYELSTGKWTWTELPEGYRGAEARAIGRSGVLVGSMANDFGANSAAMTDGSGLWMSLGGLDTEDHLFGINKFDEVAGHVHGLSPESHCGVRFAEDGELTTLEEHFLPEIRSWKIGHGVAGLTDYLWLAAEATNEVSGLPALVRLVPTTESQECGGECLSVAALHVTPYAHGKTAPVTYMAVADVTVGEGLPPATRVEATWILEGGARIERMATMTDANGRAAFKVSASSGSVEIYVTNLEAKGYRFDPTRGVLRAGK